MSKVLRAGIIGLGAISRVHIDAVNRMESARITAVCDIDENKLNAFDGDVLRFTDYKKLIDCPDVDVVHVLTPHYLHPEMAIYALRAGKHVVCEKPMAIDTDSALEMIREDEASAGSLNVIFQNRYNDSTVALKKLIDSGETGRLLGARAVICWHRTKDYYAQGAWRGKWATEGGGLLINQCIHTLDLLSFIGGPIKRVKGHVSTDILGDSIEVEDNMHAVFEYESGASGVIFASNTYVTDAPIVLEAVFEKGTYQLWAEKLFRLENGVPVLLAEGNAAKELGEKSYWGASHSYQIARIYEAIREGRRFEIDGRSAFPALNLVTAIYESSARNDWVDLIRL